MQHLHPVCCFPKYMTPLCWIFQHISPGPFLNFVFFLTSLQFIKAVLSSVFESSCRRQKWKKLVCWWTHTRSHMVFPFPSSSMFQISVKFGLSSAPRTKGMWLCPLPSGQLIVHTLNTTLGCCLYSSAPSLLHLIQLVKPLQNSNLVFQWHFKERCPLTEGF